MGYKRFGHAIGCMAVCALCAACGGEDVPTVSMSGYAFTLVGDALIENAVVSIEEYPRFRTTTDENGAYTLEVPMGVDITPRIEHPGYTTTHHRTFHSSGEELSSVNFQVPHPLVIQALSSVTGTEQDPSRCQLALTVHTNEIFGLPYWDFVAYGPHGIEGVEVSIEADTLRDATGAQEARPWYFNEGVIPEATLDATTNDGGVLFTNLAPGTYTIRADDGVEPFEPLSITCEAGWIVNAGPPWGVFKRR